MATTRQDPASLSRFSWFTSGLRFKSVSASLDHAHESEPDDSWHIPYSGPIEPPRDPFRRRVERDSWGDPIENFDAEGDSRYPLGRSRRMHGVGSDSSPTGHRYRTQSAVSVRIAPSDLSRASVVSQRRSTITSESPRRPPAPLTVSGGVGESPMPPTHHITTSKERNHTSIVGFFSGGQRTRIRTPSEKGPKVLTKSMTKTGSGQPSRLISAGHRHSVSTGSNSLWGRSNLSHGDTEATGIDDYYTSYYFSETSSRKSRSRENAGPFNHSYGSILTVPRQEEQMPISSTSRSGTRHPYSYVFPSRADDGPHTAPSMSINPNASSSTHAVAPRNQSRAPQQKSISITQAQIELPHPVSNRKDIQRVKNSASTPDLRMASPHSPSQPPAKSSSTSRIKERWLSAETWCDALLFPRPRLKTKTAGDDDNVGRMVSLPPSPVSQDQSGKSSLPRVSEQGVASRVLAHSRSLADLGTAREEPPANASGPSSSSIASQSNRNQVLPPTQTRRSRRQKSWAFDDLALPTHAPSLTRILEEREKLEEQRKKWQDQATNSFQNKRSRSISQSHSRYLACKGRKNDGGRPSNIDILAARACLGNQILTPVIVQDKSHQSSQITSFSTGSLNKTPHSHSHSHSLATTWSKTSKFHARSHSRSDSLDGVVPKHAKPAGRHGLDGGELLTNNGPSILKRDGAKILRPANLTLAQNSIPLSPSSPTPDPSIGIAISTPPLADGVETMRFPSHPYAQSGSYSLRRAPMIARPEHGVPNYVSDSSVKDSSAKANNDIPPLNFTSRVSSDHPYAQPSSSRDLYLPDTKYAYNDIPTPSKMWAQVSPNVIREIHPNDIQYSPFMSENGHESETDDYARNSQVINDTVGIGEALAYAVRPKSNRDSGLGSSEEYATADPRHQIPAQAPRSHRQPVQYDTTRPLHEKRPIDLNSAHTKASSPLLPGHQQSPVPDMSHSIRPTRATPESLPPRSPRSISDPDDLEGFYDLFYDPDHPQHKVNHGSGSGTPVGLHREAEGGLASLARHLNEELEQMSLEQGDGQSSRLSMEGSRSSVARKAPGSILEFVFEEASSPDSGTARLSAPGQHTIPPFQPSSARIPEDIESSRASSLIEPDPDDTGKHPLSRECFFLLTMSFSEVLRVGVVDSMSSSPVINRNPRASLTGQMPSPVDREGHASQATSPQLSLPSSNPTRSSSYTTASTMSGLSDFPAPPARHAAERMSILTSYFDEVHSQSERNASRPTTTLLAPSSPFDDSSSDTQNHGRLAFDGENDEMEELVAALSSHSHSTARH